MRLVAAAMIALALAACEQPPDVSPAGSPCQDDGECAGVCELGVCMPPCQTSADCPAVTPLCADLAREQPVRACTPAGEMRWFPPIQAGQPQTFMVPSSASSFAIVVHQPLREHLATILDLRGPDGTRLAFPTEDWSSPVRYDPSFGASALLLPQTPDVPLAFGRYRLTAAASRLEADRTLTTLPEVPVTVELRYRLGPPLTAPRLHLAFHFVDLTADPCWSEGTLDAVTASQSPAFQALVAEVRRIFATVPITIADVRYKNLGARPTLNPLSLTRGRLSPGLAELLSLAGAASGDHTLDLFVVGSFDPAGITAISSGVPGPLDYHGTGASGAVLALGQLCRSFTTTDLGRIAAHELAHLLGLYHVQETDGTPDLIADTTTGAGNLMHFSPGGSDLTPGQKFVLLRNPLLAN